MAIPRSFRLELSARAARFWLPLLAAAALLVPLAYLGWWGLFGGHEWEQERALRDLLRQNPVREARQALDRGDLRLYSTHGPLQPSLPGVNVPAKAYFRMFGCRGITTCTEEYPSAEQIELNRQALDFMRRYNRIVYESVLQQHPRWLEEHDQRYPSAK